MHKRFEKAFTVVELLIVIIVIGILATLVVVGYNSAIGDTRETSLRHDLTNAASDLESYRIDNNGYPESGEDITLSVSGDNEITYHNVGEWYCITGSLSGDSALSLYLTSDSGNIEGGSCEGDVTFPEIVPEIANNTPIQNITQAQCQALPIYTGSNEDALRTVQDQRGGTTRTYRIAKLADDNCWMLDNLKLGSTSSSITLTPSDSDVASNFTLPQLIASGSFSNNDPGAYGPVPGDSGTGATNYGYLYNWPAATAGESIASFPAGSGNAPHSICPASWRLPRGAAVPATNEFAMLNAKMNNPEANGPSLAGTTSFYQNWQYTGPFKGVFAGNWLGSFSVQGSNGYLWSTSAHSSTGIYFASFHASNVNPANRYNRHYGLGVRCLLD